jgi:hypothetical protein
MTSYPRPPNGSLHTALQELPELRPKITNILPTPAPTVTSAQLISKPNDVVFAPPNTPPLFSMNNSDLAIQHTPFDPMSFTLDDNFDYFSGESLDTMINYPSSENLANDSQSYETLSIPTTNGSGIDVDLSESSQLVQRAGNESVRKLQQSDTSRCNIRLSKLNMDLSTRIGQCLSSSSENSSTREGSRPEASCSESSMADLLFEQAINDLSEFLIIIQAYRTKGDNPSSDTSTKAVVNQNTSSEPNQRLSLVVFLNLISAYLQIVIVYDKVLQHLRLKLFGGSFDSFGANTATAAGDVRLSGLTGNLRTKLLVHAILHQFDVVERMLGLPADLRVTDKQSTYIGLFEDDRAKGLIGAVSNGNRIEHVWGGTTGDDSCTLKALSSLKESLRLVQTFLDT